MKARTNLQNTRTAASFPVVLGDFGCDVTCQACWENSPRTASRYRARFQASSGHSDSANRPGYEAARTGYKADFSLNFIRLLRVVSTPSVTTLLRGENDSKQSDEIQAKPILQSGIYIFLLAIFRKAWPSFFRVQYAMICNIILQYNIGCVRPLKKEGRAFRNIGR